MTPNTSPAERRFGDRNNIYQRGLSRISTYPRNDGLQTEPPSTKRPCTITPQSSLQLIQRAPDTPSPTRSSCRSRTRPLVTMSPTSPSQCPTEDSAQNRAFLLTSATGTHMAARHQCPISCERTTTATNWLSPWWLQHFPLPRPSDCFPRGGFPPKTARTRLRLEVRLTTQIETFV